MGTTPYISVFDVINAIVGIILHPSQFLHLRMMYGAHFTHYGGENSGDHRA
jgi:hypothetical protein